MTWISRPWARVRGWFPGLRDALAVLVGLATAAGTLLMRLSDRGGAAVLEGLLCSVGALALWRRRQHPVAVTVLAIIVTMLTGVQIVAVLAVATLMVRRRDRLSIALTGVAIAACVTGPRFTLLHDPTTTGELMTETISWTMVLGMSAAVGAYVGARRDLLTSLQDRAHRAEAEREIREEQGRLSERTRIAREMHDVLAHKVSLIALQAGGLEVSQQLSTDQVHDAAAQIRQTARQALEDLRDVLGVLRDGEVDVNTVYSPQPALADIPQLVESSRRAGLPVTLAGSAALVEAPSDPVGRAAYRVVQEALTNVHKHARRASTTVRIDGACGDRLRIEVVNLTPVAAGQLMPGSGLGLVGLTERVHLAGGRLEAGPTVEGGFRVMAELPWPDHRAHPFLADRATA